MLTIRRLTLVVRLDSAWRWWGGRGEWVGFGLSVVAAGLTATGVLKTATPAALLILLALSVLAGHGSPARLAVRGGLTAAAAAGTLLLRQHHPPPAVAWVGWHLLVAGSAFAALAAVPDRLLDRVRALFDHVSAEPGGRAAWSVALSGVTLPAAVLFVTTPAIPFSGDTLPVVATLARTIQAGDRDLSEFVAHPRHGRWRAFAGQDPPYNVHPSPTRPGLYSAYPAGMDVFAWPGVLAAWAAGDDLADDRVRCRIETGTAAIVAAVALALFFLTALRLTDARAAYVVTAALATGSVFWTTFGQLLWQQGGVAFWVVVVLFLELRSGGRAGSWSAAGQGVACGLMLACRPSAVTFLVPFGVWVLVRHWRRGLLVPAVAAAAYAPFALLYWELHRSLVGPSTALYGGLGWPSATNALAVLVSPGRGLFVYQPVLALAPLALLARFRSDRGPAGFYLFAVAFVGLHVLLVSGWAMWWGGHCVGSRIVGETVPVLGLVAAPVVGRLLRSAAGWLVVAAVLTLGVMAHESAAYQNAIFWNSDPADVDRHPERVWDWNRPPVLYRIPRPPLPWDDTMTGTVPGG